MLQTDRLLQSQWRRPNDSLERRSHDLLVDWLPTNHLNQLQEFQQRCPPVWPEQRRPVLNMLTSITELQLPVLPRDKPKWPKSTLDPCYLHHRQHPYRSNCVPALHACTCVCSAHVSAQPLQSRTYVCAALILHLCLQLQSGRTTRSWLPGYWPP